VLLTATDAYYYHEPCDICADVTKCALQSGALRTTIAAHVVRRTAARVPRVYL